MNPTTATRTLEGVSYQVLESDEVRICVCPEKGGELSSIVYKRVMDGGELLFRGNDYSSTELPFQGRAPLMWPTVTRNYVEEVVPTVRQGHLPASSSYRYKETLCHVPGRSGFAKDLPWTVADLDQERGICIELRSSERTKAMYPFDFTLQAAFSIEQYTVVARYTVANRSTDTMFFSIGNHIGLNVPFKKHSSIDDLVLMTSGKYTRGYDEHLMMTDELIPVALRQGLGFRDHPGVFTMTTTGYNYDDNYFRILDQDLCYEITQRVNRERGRGYALPPESEIYFTTWGGRDIGLICSEPWIGGVNSFNTRKGLIYLEPHGLFVWELRISLRHTL